MMRKCLFGKITFDLVFPDKGITENNDAWFNLNLDKVYVDEKYTLAWIVISSLHENDKKNNNKQ